MRKIQLIIICLILTLSTVNAQVTIGTETNINQSIPIHPIFTYNYSQNIYFASEIAATGNILTLTYYVTPTTLLANSNNWTIYMGHTNKTAFTSTSQWVNIVNLTQVFTGIVSISGGMVHVILDTPFNYNGTDNLIIAVDENALGADGSGNSFYSSTVVGNRAISYRSSTTNPNPNFPPTATSISSYIANVTLGGLGQAGLAPSSLNVFDFTTNSANLTWTENGTATAWNIQWDTAGFVFGTGNMLTGVTTNPINLTGLNPGKNYQFYVQADYGASGVSSWSNPYTFYTIGIPQFKFHLAFEDATGAKDTVWLILDTLATGGYDIIFGEKPISLPTGVFQVYYDMGINDTGKVSAVPTNYESGGFQILAQNYIYPLIMYWDTSLIYNNNLPFTVNYSYLDNEWFFFNNDGTLIHLFNMMNTDSVELPKFYYGSQEQFPLNFSFNVSSGVGINEDNFNPSTVSVFPNPTQTQLLVHLNENIDGVAKLKLMDIRGTVLKQLVISTDRTIVDVSNLPSGVYVIEVFNNSFSYREKIIKY